MASTPELGLDPAVLADLHAKLQDPLWRLENLYSIKDAGGAKVPFKMNDEQRVLAENLWWFNIVPKARQLGITTFFCILYLDAILFSSHKTAGVIAHTREAARKIFKEKIKFAWDTLPDWVKETIGAPETDSAQEMTFPNGSNIFVATSARSGTCQYLHISEFGKTCAMYPEKAREIVTGSINTVHAGQGVVSIESTAEGREGYFYQFCMDAKRAADAGKTLSPLEFKLFFFPWWGHPAYRLEPKGVVVTAEMKAYFDELEQKSGIKLDAAQKAWYVVKKRANEDDMGREYPSTLEEAFQASVEGAYYATHVAKLYADKRLRPVPHDSRIAVDTYWDLGMNDETVILFVQQYGPEIRVIDCYANSGEGLEHYVKILRERGYVYGSHVLPHDVEVRDLSTGLTRKRALQDMGLDGIRVAPKIGLQDGIERVRGIFSRLYIDEVKAAKLAEALSLYRKEWDDEHGVFKDKPRHDSSSHYADALRILAASIDAYATGYDGEDREPASESFFSPR